MESVGPRAQARAQPFTDWRDLATVHGQEIDKETAVTKWTGEKMDYGTAVENMQIAEMTARGVSAEMLGVVR